MALNSTILFASAAASVRAAESNKFRGMATLALVILNEAHWSTAPQPHAKLRADLLHVATTQLGIEGPTWQAYAKGMDTMADKFAAHFKGREFDLGDGTMCGFDDIQDMPEEDAIDAILALYTSHGVTTGGQIRDWAKQEGFAPFDANAVKAQRKAALDAKKKAERDASALWTTVARVVPIAPSNPDLATDTSPAPFDPMALVAGLDQAQADALVVALNAHLATLALREAARLAEPGVAPVLSDDVVGEEVVNKPRGRVRAARLEAEAA